MVKISHEVPISLLQESKSFNDYDYCLLHLTYLYPEYKKFYQNSDRPVLLDNSIFELGDALTIDEVYRGIIELKPKWYIIPDCLNDTRTTIKRFKQFKHKYPHAPGLAIGVCHGNTLKSMIKCYKYMSKHADKIALPYDSLAYEEFFTNKDNNVLSRQCKGRQLFIQMLVDKKIWNYNKPHHLLGCSLAREFKGYNYDNLNIESIDTSNPIVAGMLQIRYNNNGLNFKPSKKLCDLVDHPLSNNMINNIYFNIKKFRKICGDYVR